MCVVRPSYFCLVTSVVNVSLSEHEYISYRHWTLPSSLLSLTTVEPLNMGHLGDLENVPYSEVVLV